MPRSLRRAKILLDFLHPETVVDCPDVLHTFFNPRLLYTIFSKGLARLAAGGARKASTGIGPFSSKDGWKMACKMRNKWLVHKANLQQIQNNTQPTNLAGGVAPSFIIV